MVELPQAEDITPMVSALTREFWAEWKAAWTRFNASLADDILNHGDADHKKTVPPSPSPEEPLPAVARSSERHIGPHRLTEDEKIGIKRMAVETNLTQDQIGLRYGVSGGRVWQVLHNWHLPAKRS